MKQFGSTLLILNLLVIILGTGCANINRNNFVPPPDFKPLAEVNLSTESFDQEILGQIAVEEEAIVSIFYGLSNAETTYFDLSLIGPEGENLVILHSEDYRTDEQGGGTWEQSLPPGDYRLVLTADQGSGLLTIHWGFN